MGRRQHIIDVKVKEVDFDTSSLPLAHPVKEVDYVTDDDIPLATVVSYTPRPTETDAVSHQYTYKINDHMLRDKKYSYMLRRNGHEKLTFNQN
jgi:hypothetical protein